MRDTFTPTEVLIKSCILLLILSAVGCRQFVPRQEIESCLSSLAARSGQVVVVSSVGGVNGEKVKVVLYDKTEQGWRTSPSFDGIAGVKGLAPIGEKREGDGRTPSGIFSLGRAFGYFPLETKLDYIVLTPDMIWVDDPSSPYYNRLVSRNVVVPLSYEPMRRSDGLYRYGIVIEYNTIPVVAGAGSAIFFHVWSSPTSPTVGCVAVSEENMLKMLQWVDPSKKPVTVIGADAICAQIPHKLTSGLN